MTIYVFPQKSRLKANLSKYLLASTKVPYWQIEGSVGSLVAWIRHRSVDRREDLRGFLRNVVLKLRLVSGSCTHSWLYDLYKKAQMSLFASVQILKHSSSILGNLDLFGSQRLSLNLLTEHHLCKILRHYVTRFHLVRIIVKSLEHSQRYCCFMVWIGNLPIEYQSFDWLMCFL